MYRISFFTSKFSLTYLTATLLVLSFVLTSASYDVYSVHAQNTTTNNGTTIQSKSNFTSSENKIDTFRAKGQISSIASETLLGSGVNKTNSSDSDMWVLSGKWGFNVVNGNLTNFNADIKMTMIDGEGTHHHTIEQIKNASGNYTIGSDKKIVLDGNSTKISGFADVTTDGKIKWKDVPITVSVLNGSILNLVLDPQKTDYHFKGLPIYGTTDSIISGTGKELLVVWFTR